MPNEAEIQLKNNEEETCVFNEFQKHLRFGTLDYNLLNYALQLDAAYSPMAKRNLVVTCMDQLEEQDYEFECLTTEFKEIYGSFSPDSKDFKNITSLYQ
jgi:adenylosuccinate synthase